MKKYELVANDTIVIGGATLTRIRALIDIQYEGSRHPSVVCGDFGGYVQSEANLSHDGQCWISGEGKAYGKSRVTENALLGNKGEVCQRAVIYGNAAVAGKVRGNAKVGGAVAVADTEVIEGITHLK